MRRPVEIKNENLVAMRNGYTSNVYSAFSHYVGNTVLTRVFGWRKGIHLVGKIYDEINFNLCRRDTEI